MRRVALLATITAAAIAAAAGLILAFSSGSSALSNKSADLSPSSLANGNNNKPQDTAAGSNQQQQVASNRSSVEFGDAINLTNNPNDSVYGQVASANDNVYVVWQESVRDPASGRSNNYDIFFKASQDRGETFDGETSNLSRNAGFSEHPQLAASDVNNAVYVVWADNTSGKREILFTKSDDAGRTFGKPRVLSSPGSASSYNQELAASGSSVYLVWQEQATDGGNAIVFRASSNGGNTFADPVTIVQGNSSSVDSRSFPKVAAHGDSVYVAWSSVGSGKGNLQQQGLYFAKSSDSGSTFSPAAKLNKGNEVVGEAQVAAYGDDVHVIWGGLDAVTVANLFYVRSSDGGDTFTDPSSISSLKSPSNVELAIMSEKPQTGGDAGGGADGLEASYSLHVAAQVQMSAGNEEIMFVPNLFGGNIDNNTSTPPSNLSNNSGISECPSISISGNDVFVMWEDLTTGNHEIFLARGKIVS
ncbi:sialidase family protein [Nitrososphaera viennensis]|nr:sialidase family protein [Nitrososphaera viennensis]UVS70215.1 glycoside hydrolase [Nitrososphaera viennensis]